MEDSPMAENLEERKRKHPESDSDVPTKKKKMSLDVAKKIVSDCNVVLLDVEGTTTSFNFKKEVLFPYVEKHMENYIRTNWYEEHMKLVVSDVKREQWLIYPCSCDPPTTRLCCVEKNSEAFKNYVPLWGPRPSEEELEGLSDSAQEKIYDEYFKRSFIAHVKWQQGNNFTYSGIKQLQGHICKEGYLNKEIKGHVYDDVPKVMKEWKNAGKKIFIFSSGSIESQKMLFSSSILGNLNEYIDGNFDTDIGYKFSRQSYVKIAENLNEKPENIVFFTDRPEEVSAAKESGMNVIRIEREEPNPYLEEEKEFIGLEDAVLESFLPLL